MVIKNKYMRKYVESGKYAKTRKKYIEKNKKKWQEYNKKYMAKRREKAKRLGYCNQCLKRKANYSKSICRHCHNINVKRYKERKNE